MAFGKGRQPDKPGTYRVRPTKDGGFKLSGVKANGERVRMHGFASSSQAEDLARTLFPKTAAVVQAAQDWSNTDDWGVPLRVSDDTIGSVAKAFALRTPVEQPPEEKSIATIQSSPTKPEPTREEVEKKEQRTKNAKSLMDLVAIGAAAGDVMLGRKLCDAVDKDPVKADPKHVNDLRTNTREALQEMFGDSEVEPWKMAILLALAIPLGMLIQSPRKKKLETEASEDRGKGSHLKNVP